MVDPIRTPRMIRDLNQSEAILFIIKEIFENLTLTLIFLILIKLDNIQKNIFFEFWKATLPRKSALSIMKGKDKLFYKSARELRFDKSGTAQNETDHIGNVPRLRRDVEPEKESGFLSKWPSMNIIRRSVSEMQINKDPW